MTKNQILSFIHDINTPCKTTEIATRFDMSSYQARYYLMCLEKEGKIIRASFIVGRILYGKWSGKQEKINKNVLLSARYVFIDPRNKMFTNKVLTLLPEMFLKRKSISHSSLIYMPMQCPVVSAPRFYATSDSLCQEAHHTQIVSVPGQHKYRAPASGIH